MFSLLFSIIFICFPLLMLAQTYQKLDLFDPQYESYLKAVNKSAINYKSQYSNHDSYVLMDITSSILETYGTGSSNSFLYVYSILQLFKFSNVSETVLFKYTVNMGVITSESLPMGMNNGWVYADYLVPNHINETMLSFLCQTQKICQPLEIDKDYDGRLNQCTEASLEIQNVVKGKDYKLLLGCRFIDRSSTQTYYVSSSADAVGGDTAYYKTKVDSFKSFYYTDYNSIDIKIYDAAKNSDNSYIFTENTKKTTFVANQISDIFNIKKSIQTQLQLLFHRQ